MRGFRLFVALILAMFAVACGGSSSSETVVVGACKVVEDCAERCPEGYHPSCEAELCLCSRTEEVEVPIEVPVEVPQACESASDCADRCPASTKASCLEDGLCYCQEQSQVSQECYPLTRGEFVQQLMEKYIDLDTYISPTTPTYSDVPVNHEYYAAIEAATEMGLISGYSDSTFGPENHLNRSEGTKLVVVAVDGFTGYEPPAQPSYFDTPANAWYFDYVEAATAYGWTRGYVNQDGSPTGYFGPADPASSCFMDALMARAEFQLPVPEISIEPELSSPDFTNGAFLRIANLAPLTLLAD